MKKFNAMDNKKRNIKIILTYDGYNYSGWQRLGSESKDKSIQGVLETILSQYLGEEIKLIGSGRTDTGVHALGQVANFHTNTNLLCNDIKRKVNLLLPEDIRIILVEDVELNFHSRYSAIEKTYEYRIDIGEKQRVFTRKYTLSMSTELDIETMIKASRYFIGTHDFKGFSTDRKDGKSTIRTIKSINIYFVMSNYNSNTTNKITKLSNKNELRIAITGDGFLYNMVRIMVGTLLEVGQGIKTPDEILEVLTSGNRQKAGITISSHGLFLHSVRYM